MTVGTAIFFAGLFISLVLLYSKTKASWKWKKIVGWTFGVLVALGLLGSLVTYLYILNENKVKLVTELWEISMGMDMSDVKFIKGNPDKESAEKWNYFPKEESYGEDKCKYTIYFSTEKKVNKIICSECPDYSSPSINGLNINSSLESIVEKLGEKFQVQKSEDELYRIYSYTEFHQFFLLEKNRVFIYGIFDPKYGPVTFKKKEEEKQIPSWDETEEIKSDSAK